MFTVQVFNRSFNPTQNPFALTVQRFSAAASWGFESAEIAVTGHQEKMKRLDDWLGYYLLIRNIYHSVVWAGKVTEVHVPDGASVDTHNLDDMANRIAVAYSEEDADGNTVRGTTAWVDDLLSQARYGIKEMLESQGDLDATLAVDLRDEALGAKSKPVHNVDLLGAGSEPEGKLFCRGLGHFFSWRIFNQPGGVVRHMEPGNYEHLLGWGLTATDIGFNNNGGEYRIARLAGQLDALRSDDVIIVSGAANGGNNGTFTVTSGVGQEPESVTASDIAFEPSDDIKKPAGGLGFLQTNELMYLATSGAESWKNRYYWVGSETGDANITVRPNAIGTQSAGPSVTITQGHSVEISTALVQEFPGNSVTITSVGMVVGQSFLVDVNVPFTVAEVYVRLKRVGTPGDSVWVGIQSNASGFPNNVSLEAVGVLGSTISDKNMVWVKFAFANTLSLAYNTTYHLVVGRTGANSATDYYILDMDEDAGYANGLVTLWNGSTWVSRGTAADIPFQIWAKRQTTDQIADMYAVSNQFLAGINIHNASGRYSRMYRDNDKDAQQEMETMLAAGVANGRRLLASVSPERILHIEEEPVYSRDFAPILTRSGELTAISGQPLPPGTLLAGQWVTRQGKTADVAGVLLDKVEYDAVAGRYTVLQPKGATDPFDAVRLA